MSKRLLLWIAEFKACLPRLISIVTNELYRAHACLHFLAAIAVRRVERCSASFA